MAKLKSNPILIGLLCFFAIFFLRYFSNEKQLLFVGLLMLFLSGYKIWQSFKMRYSLYNLGSITALSLFIFSAINLLHLANFSFINTIATYILLSGSLFIFSQKRI
jgi:hypothetical protein